MSSLGGTTTANGPNSTTEQAKEKAQEGAQQAKRTVRDQVDQRSTDAGERVGTTAQDIRSVGEELRRQGKDQPARLAEQAAERAESLGDYLKRSDGDTILRDVEEFGRRQPWTVIAGGLAIGFAASRFLKASSERRAPSPPTTSSQLTAGAPTSRTGVAADDRTTPAPPLARRADYSGAPHAGPRGARRAGGDEPGAASGGAGGFGRHRPVPGRGARGPLSMSAHDPADARDRGIGELVKDLANQTSTLVRQEIRLAQAEVTERGKTAGRGAGMLAGAAVAALLGLGALTAVIVIALDGALALWLAALIVTVLWFVIAAVLAQAGKKALQGSTPPAPQTVETVKEDIQWAKSQTGSAKR